MGKNVLVSFWWPFHLGSCRSLELIEGVACFLSGFGIGVLINLAPVKVSERASSFFRAVVEEFI